VALLQEETCNQGICVYIFATLYQRMYPCRSPGLLMTKTIATTERGSHSHVHAHTYAHTHTLSLSHALAPHSKSFACGLENMDVYVYSHKSIYVFVYVRMHTQVCSRLRLGEYICACVYTHMSIYVFAHMYIHTQVCSSCGSNIMCVDIHTHTCMYIHLYIHIYMYIVYTPTMIPGWRRRFGRVRIARRRVSQTPVVKS